ncbi:MAG: hypothetical protein EXX96DRAFT_539089 [Benjaminiella poitrasii]|nr:MAG: hypothetical protein EXX96DRAFT_543548 [Benjaminiella poitrasii]KAI9477940.1 MAG: hypothetical protein EXX96DRAFT_539089 [Benjaminiella poitrasii]
MPVLCGMKKCSIYALHYRQAPLNITSIAGRCLADCKCVIPGVIIFISFMHIITTDEKLTLPTSMIYPCVFYYLPSHAITLIFVMDLGYVRLMGLSVVCNEFLILLLLVGLPVEYYSIMLYGFSICILLLLCPSLFLWLQGRLLFAMLFLKYISKPHFL